MLYYHLSTYVPHIKKINVMNKFVSKYAQKQKLLQTLQDKNQQVIGISDAKIIDPSIKNGFAIVNNLSIEEILTEEQAMTLQPSRTVSIGQILVVPRIINGKIDLLIIKERNSHNPNYTVDKFPSFTMKARDHGALNTLGREAQPETDHIMSDFVFVCAGKYSTSIEGEDHYKVCYIAKKHAPASLSIVGHSPSVGLSVKNSPVQSWKKIPKLYHPTEAGILKVYWKPINEVEKIIPKSQRTMFGPIVEKITSLSRDYWEHTPHIRPEIPFVEGPYQTKIYQPSF